MSNPPPGSLELLLDQGIPADTGALMRALGYECWRVSEFGMQKAEEGKEILSFTHERGCAVITLDADFHALIAVRWSPQPVGDSSPVRRLPGRCGRPACGGALHDRRTDLQQGALISVKEHRVTCHRLPVGKK